MYILVDKNLEISKGKLAGQVGHAVSICMYKSDKELVDEYMSGYIKKIILKCPTEKLKEYEKSGHISVRDAGFTELEPDTLTCVCLGILDKNEIVNKYLKKLRLL